MRTDGIMTTTLPRYEALVVPVAADLLAAWGRNVAATTFDYFLSTWLWGSGLCYARGYIRVVCGRGRSRALAPLNTSVLLDFLGSSRTLGEVSRLA